MASYPASRHHRQPPVEPDSGVLAKVVAVLLGLLVAVLGFFALLMWTDAREARDDAPAAGSDTDSTATGPGHAADHNVALPLSSFAGVVPENAAELAAAHKPYDAIAPAGPGRRPRQGADDAEGHDGRDRAGRQVQHLGLRRSRRPRPGGARARGPDGRDDADERRRDPALDRLPRRPHRAERRVQGRRARRLDQVPLHGLRPRRLHVPLRHEAGARPHRQRDVRRDHRPAQAGIAGGRQRVRARRQRVVPERRRDRGAGVAGHGEGPHEDARLGHLQRLREPVRHAPADRAAGRDDPLLGRGRRADEQRQLPRRRRDARPRLGQRRPDEPAADERADGGRACRRRRVSSTSRSTRRASIRSSPTPSRTSISARSACSRSATPRGR